MTTADSSDDHEIWYPVPDYPGYEFSSDHRFRVVATGKMMTVSDDGHGYLAVTLRGLSRWHTVRVHKVIATYIFGPPQDGLLTVHYDDVKHHNYPSNLSYATHRVNGLDRARNGRMPRGEDHHRRIITRELAIRVFELRREGLSLRRIGKTLSISLPVVCKILKAEGSNNFNISSEGLPHHGGGRLTESLAKEIHKLFAQGLRRVDIARQLELPAPADCVRDVVNGKTWRHVTIDG